MNQVLTYLANIWASEPLVVVAIIDAALSAAVTFGLPLTPDQKTAVDTILQLVAGGVIRSQVSSPATVAKIIASK